MSVSADCDLPLTVEEAARAIREGALTSVELTTALLERADRLDPRLGTYLARFDDTALAAARTADRELAEGLDRGPLHGIPVGIKDIFPTTEGPTTAQSAALDAGWGGGVDAPAVARLRAAGAVITGKVTTMELTLGTPDPAKPFPSPRNPWDLARWPGGSSSGSGNGVAAGLFLASLGSDTGGSIRLPAAFCGVTGLVPTYGVVPRTGAVPLAWTIDRVGPLARSVHDCAAVLDAIAGPDGLDRTCMARGEPLLGPAGTELAGTGLVGTALPGAGLDGIRIGVVREGHFPAGIDDGVRATFDAAVSVLEGLGAVVTVETLPYQDEGLAASLLLTATEAFTFHRTALGQRWEDFGRPARRSLAAGGLSSGADYVQAQRVRAIIADAVAALFEKVDLLATPTSVIGAVRYDEHGEVALEETVGRVFTPYWNLMGNPLLAFPIGFTADGLPLSLQLAAAPLAEPLLVRAGQAYQQVTDWHLRQPPLVTGDPERLPASSPPPSDHRSADAVAPTPTPTPSTETPGPDVAAVARRLADLGVHPTEPEVRAIAAAWIAGAPFREALWAMGGPDGPEPAVAFSADRRLPH